MLILFLFFTVRDFRNERLFVEYRRLPPLRPLTSRCNICDRCIPLSIAAFISGRVILGNCMFGLGCLLYRAYYFPEGFQQVPPPYYLLYYIHL